MQLSLREGHTPASVQSAYSPNLLQTSSDITEYARAES